MMRKACLEPITFAADSLFGWGPPLAEIDVAGRGKGREWTTITARVESPPAGVHTVWLRFWSEKDEGLAAVDWFEFR